VNARTVSEGQGRCWRRLLAPALACAALIGSAPAASAESWALDGSFGSGGVGWLPGLDVVVEMRHDDQGRALLVGRSNNRLAVARFTADGAPDGSFGSGGIAIGPPRPPDTSADDGLGTGSGTALAIDAQGRVIAAGVEDIQVGTKGHRRWLVTRFTEEGDLDPSFSPGSPTDGWELVDVNVDSLLSNVAGVVVQPGAGRIVVMGCLQDQAPVYSRFAIAALLPTGQRDTEFASSGTGVLQHSLAGQPDNLAPCPQFATAQNPDGSGDLLMAGYKPILGGSTYWLSLARYSPDGDPRANYAGGGTVYQASAHGWGVDGVLEDDGRLSMVLGISPVKVQDVTADGTPGAVRALPPSWQGVGSVMRVAGGRWMTGGWYRTDPASPSMWSFGRLNPDLTPDESFAPGGQIVAAGTLGDVRDLVVVDGAHVLAAGGYFTPNTHGVARLTGPPPPDTPPATPDPAPTPGPVGDHAPSPPANPAPAPARPPVSRLTGIEARMRAGALMSIRGTAEGDVASVRVAVVRTRRRDGRLRCRQLRPSGRWNTTRPRGRRCTVAIWLPATGTTSFGYRLPRSLPPGRYWIASRAADAAGNAEAQTSSNLRRVRLR